MCNENNHKSYGLGLTYSNKVNKRIVYILDNDFFSFNNGFTILWIVAL